MGKLLPAMNSLNIVSRFTTTPPPSPPRSRTSSGIQDGEGSDGARGLDLASIGEKLSMKQDDDEDAPVKSGEEVDEKTPTACGRRGCRVSKRRRGVGYGLFPDGLGRRLFMGSRLSLPRSPPPVGM